MFKSMVRDQPQKYEELIHEKYTEWKKGNVTKAEKILKEQKNKASLTLFNKLNEGVSPLNLQGLKIEIPSYNTAKGELDFFNKALLNQTTGLTDQCEALMKAVYQEQNSEKKQQMITQVKEHALQILNGLPTPGSEGITGLPSIWSSFSKVQKNQFLEQISTLERLVFESQMKLAQPNLSAKERFLLVKAQAIRQAIVRSLVSETKEQMAKLIDEASFKSFLDETIVKVENEKIVNINWEKIDTPNLASLAKIVKDRIQSSELIEQLIIDRASDISDEVKQEINHLAELANYQFEWNEQTDFPSLKDALEKAGLFLTKETAPHLSLLLLENYTMDTNAVNILLTQDLTSCLSENAELEEDLIALYYFILHDKNSDVNYIRSGTGSREPMEATHPQVKSERIFNPIHQSIFDEDSKQFKDLRRNLSLEDNHVIKNIVTMMKKGEIYYKVASDANLMLHSHENVSDVGFFERDPDGFFKEKGPIDLEFNKDNISIQRENKIKESKVLAKININGVASISRTLPFLPVTGPDSSKYNTGVKDIRVCKTYGIWQEYATEVLSQGNCSLPRDVLAELYQIRQTSIFTAEYQTSYDAGTAIRAISFICNAKNQIYLKDASTRKFLNESMFGPFLMQQALISQPETILVQIDLLAASLKEATRENDLVLISFLSNIITELHSHVRFSENQLKTNGWFSGLVQSLPNQGMRGFGPGASFFAKQYQESRELNVETIQKLFSTEPQDFLNSEKCLQPMLYHMGIYKQCKDKLDYLEKLIPDSNSDVKKPFLVRSTKNELGIDEIKNADMRRELYAGVVTKYKNEHASKKLGSNDIEIILQGYKLFLDSNTEPELVSWVRTDVLPKFNPLKPDEKLKLLKSFLSEEVDLKGKQLHQDPEFSNQYVLELENKVLKFDLYKMELANNDNKAVSREVWIPSEIMNRTDVAHALKLPRIKATLTNNKSKQIYKFSHEGEKFAIVVKGKDVAITRIKLGVKYKFQSVDIESPQTYAEKLLSDNGLWMPQASTLAEIKGKYIKGAIFAGQDTYFAKIDAKSGKILSLFDENNQLVSQSKIESYLPFTTAENSIILLDSKNKIPNEIRLKNESLIFKKEEGLNSNWVCFKEGKRVGEYGGIISNDVYSKTFEGEWIKSINPENLMTSRFGSDWKEFVIPLVEDGKLTFLLLNGSRVVQRAESVTILPNGTVKGSISAHLILTHRFLHQAVLEKNATVAKTLYAQAEGHIQALNNMRPSSDELKSMKHVTDLFKNSVVSLDKMPSPIGLALNLKALIAIRKIKEISNVEESVQERSLELEAMVKLHEAYNVMKLSGQFGLFEKSEDLKISQKTSYSLNESEESELFSIGRQLLKDIATEITNENLIPYFGASGRLETALSIDRPKTLNPQFLLTLLRVAKNSDETIDIRNINSPLPLNDLVENFWSYLLSIRKHKLSPEDLVFLFEPSLIVTGKTKEEDERLSNLDVEAREFLLFYANLQAQLPKDKTPFEVVAEKVTKAKEILETFTKNIPPLDAISKNLDLSFKMFKEGVENLQVKHLPSAEGADKYPDIKSLKTDVDTINTHLDAFISMLDNTIIQSENFIKDAHTKKAKALKNVQDLEHKLETIEHQLSEMMDVDDDRKIALQLEHKETLSKTNESRNVYQGQTLVGLEQKQKDIAELNEVSKVCKEKQTFLTDFSKSAEDIDIQFRKYMEMDGLFKKLENEKFQTMHDLKFPEKGPAKDLLIDFIQDPGKQIDLLEVFKTVGVIDSIKLALQAKKFKDENVIEKIKTYAGPLAALVFVAQTISDKSPISIGSKPKSALLLEFDKILNHPNAESCFTQDELKNIEESLLKMNSLDKGHYLNRLTAALKSSTNANELSQKMDINEKKSEIDKIYKARCDDAPKEVQKNENRKNENRKDRVEIELLNDKYKPFFTQEFQLPEESLINQIGLKGLGPNADQSVFNKLQKNINVILYGGDSEFGPESGPVAQQAVKNLMLNNLNSSFIPYFEMLEFVGKARNNLSTVDKNNIEEKLAALERPLNKCNDAKELLEVLKAISQVLQPFQAAVSEAEHQALCQDLLKTLPANKESQYTEDLRKGFENLQGNNPLKYSEVISENQLDALDKVLEADREVLKTDIHAKQSKILTQLNSIPIVKLPKELQKIRFRKGTDRELLDAAYRHHRKGEFAPKNEPKNESKSELDELITAVQMDETRLKLLVSAKFNAKKSLESLETLNNEKSLLRLKFDSAEPEEKKAILDQMSAVKAKWMRESSRLQDCIGRCQTIDLKNLPDRLKIHERKIVYLQNKLGMVLREDQLTTLLEIVENPALLKQLRMGLGKTSVLVPFALEILANEGFNPIGMVPKALFKSNFDEMDETTRTVFEMSGNEFLFNRQDALPPFSTATLSQLSNKCHRFFKALENGEYILTTIESKASMDNKISEVEISVLRLDKEKRELVKEISDTRDKEKIKVLRESLGSVEKNIANHETVLSMLYRVKAVFEHDNTRLIIDEIDGVAKANYSINSEVGSKVAPESILRESVSKMFSIIANDPKLISLKQHICNNSQYGLKDAEIDGYIQEIGKVFVEKNKDKFPKSFLDSLENVSNLNSWFSGGKTPFNAEEIRQMSEFGFDMELSSVRKALNQSLRSSLKLKIGLSADFDPTHSAVGVPASLGTTSKTTKFSDPLMQLTLTMMMAMNKPQGEEFLKAAALDVYTALKKENIKDDQINRSINALETLFEDEKQGVTPSYQDVCSGMEDWKIFLRQKFAEQAANRALIYVTDSQISRPAQDALRGCHVIGLTGTATRNTEHVINSYKGAKPEIKPNEVKQSGRETTAEVIYRLSKGLSDGLKTKVAAYSLDADQALLQYQNFAKKNSGYTFLIDQAGAVDKYSQKEIVLKLHEGGRPIVFLDIETGKKSVLINRKLLNINAISDVEKVQVASMGFYYYAPSQTRGTHFDIPTGAKGAMMLLSTVNANDRDQGIYRARELGEGHIVEPFISEQQHAELKLTGDVTLDRVLQLHHDKTLGDEQQEDFAAYQLHIKGLLRSQVEGCKKELQIANNDPNKLQIFGLFDRFLSEDGGNDVVIRCLRSELYSGAEITTQDSLLEAIDRQKNQAEKLLNSLKGSSPVAQKYLKSAILKLDQERNVIENNWESIGKKYKEKTSGGGMEETAETEAEAEAESQQETTSETASETARGTRSGRTKDLLTKVDNELLDSLKSDAPIDIIGWNPLINKKPIEKKTELWKPTIKVSERLAYSLMKNSGSSPVDMRLLLVKHPIDGNYYITAAQNFEADFAITSIGAFFETQDPRKYLICNGSIIHIHHNMDGGFKFISSGSSQMVKGIDDNMIDKDKHLQAEMLLTLVHLGVSTLSDDQWKLVSSHYKQMALDEQSALQNSLKTRIGTKSPSLYNKTLKVLTT